MSRFRTFSWITLFSIFLVVLAGGIVRMTGSGMGCPDWPKCFDCYIPPTDISQLPENYKEIYSQRREKKIARFANFLTSLGFDQEAKEIVEDKSLLKEQDFSAFNTWTEYLNRLAGAVCGLLILIQSVISFAQFRKRKLLSLLAFFLLILTGFQAWFGAMVVATNIVPWVLSTHMLIAILMILAQLVIIKLIAGSSQNCAIPKPMALILIFGIILMFIQTVWGTQVRQQIDVISESFERKDWVDQLTGVYFYHRTMALFIIAIGITFFYLSYKHQTLKRQSYYLITIILIEGLVGKLFSVLGMPAALQPVHITLSMILLSIFFYTLISNKILTK